MKRLAYLFVVGALACGSESGGGNTGTPDPDEGKTFKETVVAADGGTVSTESGSASVEIPKDALDGDKEISIAVEPGTGEAQSSIYDFGPDGTTFQNPVTISIKFDGDPGTDMKAVLGWLDDGVWTEIENSKLENGVVSGDVMHFSKFTVIFVDDKAVLISDCSNAVKDFTACGGDLIGTWKFKDLCLSEDVVLGENPFTATCQEAVLTAEVEFDGTVTFDGSVMTMTLNSQTMVQEVTVPMTCVTELEAECADLTDDLTCAVAGDDCICTKTQTNPGGDPMVQDYTIDGSDIVIDEGPDEDPSRVPYCVQGDTVISENDNIFGGEVGNVYMILTKM